jgi:hypothetical protein
VFFPAGDELCLHHIGTGEYYLLNDVAQDFWNLCNGELSFEGIAARMAEAYDAPLNDIVRDARELMEYLESEECLLLLPAATGLARGGE